MNCKANKLWKDERGASLFELTILILLIGVALPSVLGLMSQMSLGHIKNEKMYGCVSLANSKMEEIVVFKNNNDTWYNTINSFVGEEVISGGYKRTVALTITSNWISSGIEAYEIAVTISHPNLSNSYTLTRIFIK
jgi:hypothetical protein